MIDSHIHLCDQQYEDDLEEVISRAAQSGIEAMILPGTDIATSKRVLEIAQEYQNRAPKVYCAVGIHPHEAGSYSKENLEIVRNMCGKACAVGEIGLDFHYNFSTPQQQTENLIAHLNLAKEVDLPVIIHCRKADEEMLSILRTTGLPKKGGVVHCFSSTLDAAKQYLDLGLYLGFTGMVTYPKLTEVREAATFCPLDRLLLETDGPYLAPVPYRGRRNEPSYVPYILKEIAALRGIEESTLEKSSNKAVRELFNIA